MKKRILALALCIVTLLTFAACGSSETEETPAPTATNTPSGNAIHPISIQTGTGELPTVFSDSYKTLIETAYPVMHVSYGDEEKFSALGNALKAKTSDARENQAAFIEEYKESAMDMYNENPEYFGGFSSEEKVFVKRADTLVTSLLFHNYSFTGGVHPNYGFHGESYDTETGKRLSVSDVVNDTASLAPAIRKELETLYNDVEFFDDGTVDEILGAVQQLSWTVDYNGITFYFSPYSLAPYAAGMQVVTLSNKEYPDILKDKYKEVPASYGVELTSNLPFYYDVTGDGEVDKIVFSAPENVYGIEELSYQILINDVPYTEKELFFETDATFVHTEDGNYIYVELTMENDYRDFLCFAIGDKVEKRHTIKGGLRYIFHESDEYHMTKDTLSNPDSFYIQRITQHLSTASGHKEYHIGKNGEPVSDSPMYVFDEEKYIEFTLLQDLEADIYDETTNKVNGKKTLKKGDKVMYCATDCEKYALLRTEDGTLLRVQTVRDDDTYRVTINGIKLEDLFEGLFFAG